MLFKLILIVVLPFFFIALLLRLQRIFKWEWLEKLLRKTDMPAGRHRRYLPLVELLFIPVIIVLVVISFRKIKPQQPQYDSRIAVLADSLDLDRYRGLLTEKLGNIIRTPQPEQMFQLHFFSGVPLSGLAGFNYVLVLSSDPSGHAAGVITDELKIRPVQGRAVLEILRRPGENRGNRVTAAVMADSPPLLTAALHARGKEILAAVKEDAMHCKRDALFTSGKEAAVSEDLLETYGWSFTRLADMQLAEENPEQGFVAFSPWTPGRYLFVHWVEQGDTAWLNPRWMKETRNSICAVHYDSTYVTRHYFRSERRDFLGRPALVTRGLWADDNPDMGGPFTNYTFYDPGDKRVYMIDVFVFRPGQDKLPFLVPLEVMAHTFITAGE